MAARIFSDVMEGDESSRLVFGILTQAGIQVILEDNQYGIGPRDVILNNCVTLSLQITHLHDCIWNALDATMRAREKFRKQKYSVLSQS